MREALLKLIDMCKETDGLWIEIGKFCFEEVWITIIRDNRRCRRVITRDLIEKYEDTETLMKTMIKYCDDVMKSEEAVG